MKLVTKIYELTESFPQEEKYELTNQIRRSAVSIPSNIAEGSGRNTNKDFNNFLGYSTGSSYELETQLLFAEKLKIIQSEKVNPLIEELHSIQKRIYNFKQSLLK